MTPEQIQAIIQAATAGDQAGVTKTLAEIEKQAADRAAGVEDVTAALKAKRDELLGKVTEWGKLGPREEVAAKLEELAKLKAAAEEAKLKGEAEKVGASHEQVEALANKRAEAMFQAKVAEWTSRTEKLEAAAKAGAEARETLEKKLHQALVDHELYKVAGADVDPVLYPYLRDKAAPFFKPRVAANGESEAPWWAPDQIEFDLVDPNSGARLVNDDGKPMATKGLVDARKADDWSVFFVPKGRGGGASTTTATSGSGKLPWNAGSGAFLDKVLGGG